MKIDKVFMWVILAVCLVCIAGFGIDVMDIDASQYASMSREMMQSGSYLQVYDHGKDYLDKPPFLFWASALSMKIFGAGNFAYRFPSFLFALLAILSTYRLALHFYGRRIAIYSAIILATTQGFFLMSHDVRTDTMLMGWVALACWQLAIWTESRKFIHFFVGCVAIAGGMMTKGPIALLVPAFAIGSQVLLRRDFKVLWRWEYLAGILIIAVLLLPMCIGLYRQFDDQPNKIVNGQAGVSGLRFFFWTQSFGRITGESPWDNNAGIFFLLKNMLWSFLPWIIFFLIGFYRNIIAIIRNRFFLKPGMEAVTTGGFLLSYLSLGLSNYQLPHYIFVAFPFAAIITAKYTGHLMDRNTTGKAYNILFRTHQWIFGLLFIGLIILMIVPFQSLPLIGVVIASLLLIGYLVLNYASQNRREKLLWISAYTIISINLCLNLFFYPALLKYQAGSTAGKWITRNSVPKQNVYLYGLDMWRSLDFYSGRIIQRIDDPAAFKKGDIIITNPESLHLLDNSLQHHTVKLKSADYPVSRLSIKFLDPKRRGSILKHFVIVEVL